MKLSKVSVCCNSHVYVCLGNTTKKFRDIKNLDEYEIQDVYVQGNNVFIQCKYKAA